MGHIVEVDVQRPYYGLLYINSDGTQNKIVVVYDRIAQQIQVLSNLSISAPVPVSTPVPTVTVTSVSTVSPPVPIVPVNSTASILTGTDSLPQISTSTSTLTSTPTSTSTPTYISTSASSTSTITPIIVSTGQTSGYVTLDPTQNSLQAIDAINFANNYYNKRLTLSSGVNSVQLTKVQQQQIVNNGGINFKISYLLDNTVEYEVIVFRSQDAKMQIISANFVNLFSYKPVKTVPIAQILN